MPIIRAQEQVAPQAPPVVQDRSAQDIAALAQGLQQAGQSATNAFNTAVLVGSRQEALRRKKQQAFAQAKAVKDANEAEILLSQELTDLQNDLVALGEEDRYEQEALELVEFHRTNVEESTANSLMGDAAAARSAIEARFQPIRRSILKISADLIASKAKKSITEAWDLYRDNIKEETDITNVGEQLDNLFTDIDVIAASGGINPTDTVPMKEAILVETLRDRQDMWLEMDPDAAFLMMTMDADALRDKLDAVNGLSLSEASQQSEAAFNREVERQLKTMLQLHAIKLDDALEEAARLGLDPTTIASTYDNRVNREQNQINFRQQQDAKRAKESSDQLGSELRKKWLKGKTSMTAMQADLEDKWLELEPDERNSLIKFMQALDKNLATAVDDPNVVRQLEFEVFDNPLDPRTGDSIVAAREAGNISEAKMEELFNNLFAAREKIRTKADETRLRQFNTIKSEVGKFLDTTSALDFDPVARDVKDKAFDRINKAFYGPELVKGDATAFRQNPIGFGNRIKREYRQQLDQAIGELGYDLALKNKYILLPTNIAIERVVQDQKDDRLSKQQAERLLHFYNLVDSGRFIYPKNHKIEVKKLDMRERAKSLISPAVPGEQGAPGRAPSALSEGRETR